MVGGGNYIEYQNLMDHQQNKQAGTTTGALSPATGLSQGKPPFCQKRKWNKKPCRSDYKPPPCLKAKYPNFVSYQGIANHGDVCRHNNGQYYQCPTGCFKTRNGRRPFCQKAKWIKKPCRVENLPEIAAIGNSQMLLLFF